jgi:hypothetical protein
VRGGGGGGGGGKVIYCNKLRKKRGGRKGTNRTGQVGLVKKRLKLGEKRFELLKVYYY